MKILLTSTSFQDTPGMHQDALNNTGWEIIRHRGPLSEKYLMKIIEGVDAVICGDDEYTKNVIRKGAQSKLKVISKYGVGLDSIDQDAAKEHNIIITNCPGVNQNAVAEHVFGLLLTFYRQIIKQNEFVHNGKWTRLVGNEISDKKLGIFGFGAVGQKLAEKAVAWGMQVFVVDKYYKEPLKQHKVKVFNTIEELVGVVDILSMHTPLTSETFGIISERLISTHVKPGLVIVNTARGKLVDNQAILNGLSSNTLKGYLADVLEEEPIIENHPFTNHPNIILTPHVGSRTHESVQKQGMMAVQNTVNALKNA